jgi:metal-responsive CopG/Arc/MetJ family transcriptional regulator
MSDSRIRGSRASRIFTISFPEELAKQVIAVADEESRNISELFREAFRTYRTERLQRKLTAARLNAAERMTMQPAEGDVEPIVDEIRSEQFSRKRLSA